MNGIAPPANFWKIGSDRNFKMHHHLRHATYDYAASRMGVALAGLDLTGDITVDWLSRHAFRHAAYITLLGVAQSPTVGLYSVDWENSRAVQDWMHYHSHLHADLNQFFGLQS